MERGVAAGMLWGDVQLLSLAVMFLAGAGLALLNDLCRVALGGDRARSRRRTTRPSLRLWDLVFWLLVTPLVFAAALVSNYGQLRIYVFVGLAVGVSCYLLLGRPLVVAVGTNLRRSLVSGVRRFSRWAARPVKAAAGRAAASLRRLLGGFRRTTTE